MLELWELGGRNDCRFSTFAWRTRLALWHKSVPFEAHPVAVSDKEAITFSGQGKVPIIRHGEHVVFDSWSIAVYLERAFPERASLFGGAPGENLTQIFNIWADRELVPALVPYLMRDVLDCVENEADARHLRNQIEGLFKKSLEDLYSERAERLVQFRRRLAPVRKVLAATPFIGGENPAYADYVVFGILQWARIVSRERVLEPDDVVTSWFERVLDLYGRAARQEPSRADRMKEAAA